MFSLLTHRSVPMLQTDSGIVQTTSSDQILSPSWLEPNCSFVVHSLPLKSDFCQMEWLHIQVVIWTRAFHCKWLQTHLGFYCSAKPKSATKWRHWEIEMEHNGPAPNMTKQQSLDRRTMVCCICRMNAAFKSDLSGRNYVVNDFNTIHSTI